MARLKDTGARRIEYFDGEEWRPAKMGRGGRPYCYGFVSELREIISATGSTVMVRVTAKHAAGPDVQWIAVEDEEDDRKNRK